MQGSTITELLLSFAITWAVVLVPPAIIRAIRGRPLGKVTALVYCLVFYFANVVFFSARGGQSTSHMALLLGAWFSFYIFRWQTEAGAEKLIREKRKALGYDE